MSWYLNKIKIYAFNEVAQALAVPSWAYMWDWTTHFLQTIV